MSGTNSDANLYPQQVPTADEWNALFVGKVDANGGFLTNPTVIGAITITNTPMADLDGVNKVYVDSKLGPGGGGSLPDAPVDGTPYCRQNNNWVAAPTTLIASVSGDLHVPGNMLVQGATQLTGSVLIGVSTVAGLMLDVDGNMAVRGIIQAGGLSASAGIDGTPLGKNTPSTGVFTTLTSIGTVYGAVGWFTGAFSAFGLATLGSVVVQNTASVTGTLTVGTSGAPSAFTAYGPSTFVGSVGISGGGLALTGPTGTLTVGGDTKIVGKTGFNGANPFAKPTVIGSRGGNAALASLLTFLASYGLVIDGST